VLLQPVSDWQLRIILEDSVYATPTPKGRQTKQSRSVQRYSKSRDVFDGDVRIPGMSRFHLYSSLTLIYEESSPSKPGRAKVVVDSEDEPPPTARPRKRQGTFSSDFGSPFSYDDH